MAAGKAVHPVLRYRDADGSVFSQSRNCFGRSETTSLLTATPSTSTQSTPDASQSESDSASARSASEASDSDTEDIEEEVPSHLQRLQGLAGMWRRHNKRPRLGRETAQGGTYHEGLPAADAMQVYVHGIDETGLQSALTKSSLWHRIELNNHLEVGMPPNACIQTAFQHLPNSFPTPPVSSVGACA